MPAGTRNYFKKRDAEAQMQKTQQETSTKTPLAFLDEGDSIGYSLLFRPVKPPPFNFSGFFENPVAATAKNTEAAASEKESSDAAKAAVAATKGEQENRMLGNLSTATMAYLKGSTSLINDTSTPEVGSYICMPLPIALRDAVSVQYSQADLGSLGAGLQLGQDVYRSYQEEGSVLGAAADGVAGGGSYLLRTLLSEVSSSAGAFIQKGAGNIPNPFSVTLFEKVQLRTFNFEWIIQPKSPEEAKRIKRIINLIRYYSLPAITDNLYLDVPFEWEIAFLGNDTLFAFSRCVLENMETNYSPNGFPSFMEDHHAQSISLTLQFKEIYPLTKQSVLMGPSSMDPQLDGVFGAPEPTDNPNKPPESSTEASAETQRANTTSVQDQIKVLEAETKRLKMEADRLRKTGDASLQDEYELVYGEYTVKLDELEKLQASIQ